MTLQQLTLCWCCCCWALAASAAAVGDAEGLRRAEQLINAEKFAEAETLLASELSTQPQDVQILYRLGYVEYRQRKLAPARKHLESAVRIAPPALYSRYFLGRIALLEEKPKEAVEWLRPAAEAAPAIFDASAQLGKAYEETGQHALALQQLKAAAARTPWDGALYFRMGRLYRALGKPGLAAEALKTGQKLKDADRESVESILNCSVHLAAGEASQAFAIRDRLLGSDSDPSALVALGVVFGGASMDRQALEIFEAAAKRDPASFPAYFNSGLAWLKLERPSEAIGSLRKAVELLPEAADANAALGTALVLTSRFSEAAGPLQRARSGGESAAGVTRLLALSYTRSGRARDAVPLLRELVAAAPDDPRNHYLLVESFNAAEEPEKALAAAQAAAARFPAAAQAHLAFAQQLARMGRYQDAAPEFQKTVDLDPRRLDAWVGLAEAAQKRGDHAAAIAGFRRALAGPAPDLAAALGLARSLIATRQFAEARDALEAALPAFPAAAPLHAELARVYARLGEAGKAAEHSRLAAAAAKP